MTQNHNITSVNEVNIFVMDEYWTVPLKKLHLRSKLVL